MKKDSRQRLFEVMGRLDKTFKPRLNEEILPNNMNMDDILDSYFETALWAEESDENQLSDKTIHDIEPEVKANSAIEVYQFLQAAQQQASDELSQYDAKSLGHNLWLSRNGHGAGFFDDHHDKLQNLARGMKPVDIYLGDDGKVYIS